MAGWAARAGDGPESEWLTLDEAATYLKVSKPTVYRLCSAGKLRYYHLAGVGSRRFRKADLERLIVPASGSGRTVGRRFTSESLREAIRAGERTMKGRVFEDDSADLIAEARRERTEEL